MFLKKYSRAFFLLFLSFSGYTRLSEIKEICSELQSFQPDLQRDYQLISPLIEIFGELKLLARNQSYFISLISIKSRDSLACTLRFLLDLGVDVNGKSPDGKIALHCSARCKNLKAVRTLLQFGADPLVENGDNEIPLWIALNNGCNEIVDLLLGVNQEEVRESLLKELPADIVDLLGSFVQSDKPGDQINFKNIREKTLLDKALAERNKRLARTILMMKDCDKVGILHMASQESNSGIVRMLINMGFDVNERWRGYTPLHIASRRGNSRIIKILLTHNADIDGRDDHTGRTPLHFAVLESHKKAVGLLCRSGANQMAKDDCQATPLEIFDQGNECESSESESELGKSYSETSFASSFDSDCS